MGDDLSLPGKSAKRVFCDLTRQPILSKKMDARGSLEYDALRAIARA
jgi:hypothetical protein